MDDNRKILQAILAGQNAMKRELVGQIEKLDKKLSGRMDSLDQKINQLEKNLTKRINSLGKYLAYLEDDTPTREEFDGLKQRVAKVEQKTSSAT